VLYLEHAWNTIKKHPLQWIIFNLIMGLANQLFVGWLLMPNALRVIRKSVDEGTAPDINLYFNFDDIGDDAATMLVLMLIYSVAGACCGVPLIIVAPLCFWTAHLAADRSFTPVDNIKASFAHAKGAWVDIFSQMIIIGVTVTVGVFITCLLGSFIALVFGLIAFDRFYQDNKDDIYAAAAAGNVPRKA